MNKQMKYIGMALAGLVLSACNSAIDYELFDKHVLLTKNGWVEQTLWLRDNSAVVEIPFAVSVNGTTGNDKNLSVSIALDEENLASYNFDKYRNQRELYYQMAPEEVVSFQDKTIQIPPNDIRGVSVMTIDISKLTDKYADYVIPVKIASTSDYKIAPDYGKALYHLSLKNDFSGDYMGEIRIYQAKSNGEPNTDSAPMAIINTKSFYAISDSVCYFYAGKLDRNLYGRDDFLVELTIKGEEIKMEGVNPDLKLTSKGTVINRTVTDSPTDQRYELVTVEMDLSYTYVDLTATTKPTLWAGGKVNLREQRLKQN